MLATIGDDNTEPPSLYYSWGFDDDREPTPEESAAIAAAARERTQEESAARSRELAAQTGQGPGILGKVTAWAKDEYKKRTADGFNWLYVVIPVVLIGSGIGVYYWKVK